MAERRLYDAAAKGDEKALHELLQEDPLLLNRVSYTSPNKTPLHIATIHGHLPFVEQILNQNPHLAEELDSQQSSALHVASAKDYVEIVKKLLSAAPDMGMTRDSQGRDSLHLAAIKGHVRVLEELLREAPFLAEELDSQQSSALHVASAKGYVEIVKKLLSAAPDMCMSRDSQGRNPLHLAAIKGHVRVLEELLREAPFAAREKADGGLSLLHLCVKYSHFEALEILVPQMNELLNWKDDDGDTILHMAVRDKRIEAINFLLTVAELEVNAVNLNGMTALDVLTQSRRDSRDSAIEESLKRAGALRRRLFPYQAEWLEKKKSALMVVAILIATMAFQVGVNPPGGVWQEDKVVDPQGNQLTTDLTNRTHRAGFSIMARNDPDHYIGFYIFNTISFIASLSIILLLMSGLPLRRRFFMWILMVITWISITTSALTYLSSTSSLIPDNARALLLRLNVVSSSVYGWIGLMALLLIVHTIRLIIKLIRKLREKRMRRQRRMGPGSAGV